MDEAAARENEAEQERPFLNISYIRDTWIGRLKIVEFLCSLLAGALVPATVYKHAAAFGFMSFVTWTTVINVVIDLVLHLIYVWEKITFITEYPEIMMFLCTLGAFGLGIASVTELAVATYAQNPNLPSASAVFGIMCMAALIIECYFHYQDYKVKADERRQRQQVSNYQPYQPDNTFSNINDV